MHLSVTLLEGTAGAVAQHAAQIMLSLSYVNACQGVYSAMPCSSGVHVQCVGYHTSVVGCKHFLLCCVAESLLSKRERPSCFATTLSSLSVRP